jgi:hypothetical protein
LSGLLDRFPRLTVLLGHQGEGLPFLLSRVKSRRRHASAEIQSRELKPVTAYLRENQRSHRFRSIASPNEMGRVLTDSPSLKAYGRGPAEQELTHSA